MCCVECLGMMEDINAVQRKEWDGSEDDGGTLYGVWWQVAVMRRGGKSCGVE